MNQEAIEALVSANKLILDDIINSGNFSIEELELVSNKTGDLIKNLAFWLDQDNSDRFFYELKNYLNWLLENFS
jgi:hypothetical protein